IADHSNVPSRFVQKTDQPPKYRLLSALRFPKGKFPQPGPPPLTSSFHPNAQSARFLRPSSPPPKYRWPIPQLRRTVDLNVVPLLPAPPSIGLQKWQPR